MAADIGFAALQVIPSVKGISQQLGRGLTTPFRQQGMSLGKTLGVGMLAGVAGVVAAGKGLYEVGQVFHEVRSTIVAGTGASGKALQGLEKVAKNVGKTTPASFKDVGTAVADLNTRLGISGKPLEAMSKKFLDLSRITKTDLSSNIANATRVFGDWDITAKDQPKALDAIFEATKRTGIGLDTLTNNVVQFGAPLRQFGFGFEESLALFGKWEKEGVNTQVVLSGMKQALGRFSKAGKEPRKELDRISEAIKGTSSAGEANKIAIEAFGQRAGPDMAAAIREGRFELGDMVKGLKNSKGAIDDAAKRTMGFTETWQILKNRALVLLEPVATRVFKALADFGGWLVSTGVPALEKFAGIVWERLQPAFDRLRGIIGRVAEGVKIFIDAFTGKSEINEFDGALRTANNAGIIAREVFDKVVGTVKALVGWVVKNKDALIPIAGAILAAVAAWKTYILVTKGIAAVKAAIAGMTLAVKALNVAMRANLIGIIITAIVALVAGLVLAYKKSETFRKIVDTAFKAVSDAGKFMWNSVLKPAFNGIKTAFKSVGDAAKWLWNNAIKPAWNAIKTAGKLLFAVIATVVIAPIILYFKMWAAIAKWLWNSVLKPVFSAIGKIAKWLWSNVIKPVVNFIVKAFKTYGAVAKWLWNQAVKPAIEAVGRIINWLWRSVVKPAFSAIGSIIKAAWNGVIKPTWDALKRGVQFVGDKFEWLKNGVIRPVWDWIKDKITNIWKNGVKPVFDKIKSAVGSVGGAFESAKTAVGKAWDKVAGIVRKPINWVITNVINDGIIGTFNKIAKAVGLDLRIPKVGTIGGYSGGGGGNAKPSGNRNTPGFAAGGMVYGPGSGTSDSILARLSAGEFVVPAKETKRHRGLLEAIRSGMHLPGYARGGVVYPVGKGNQGRATAGHGYPAVDYPRGMGTRVAAAMAGVISSVRHMTTSYGKHVRISHGGGLSTLYAHLSSIVKNIGDRVNAGTTIGRVGSTGNSTGPHLHFEALRNGSRIDPLAFLRGGASPGGGGGGGIGGFIDGLWKKISNVGDWLKDKGQAAWDFVSDAPGVLKKFLGKAVSGALGGLPGGGFFKKMVTQFPTFIVDKVASAGKALASKIKDVVVGSPGSTDGSEAQKYAQSLMPKYGWGQGQWAAWRELGNRESGWRWNATNPSSGAYGIPQALPGSKMASAGADWRTNALTQVRWMAGYIKDRYGSPSSALSFHDRMNWYDNGGIWRNNTFGANKSGGPEYVFNRSQWGTLKSGFRAALAVAEGGEVGPSQVHFHGRRVDINERTIEPVMRIINQRRRTGRPS